MIGSAAFLVDTNVLVYAYDLAEPVKRARATTVLRRLRAHSAGALTTQVLNEFFVTTTRKIPAPLSVQQAELAVTAYVRSWIVHNTTPLIVLEAVRGVRTYQFSYWDSLIWASAKLNAIPNVLSEDFADGAIVDGVRFLNPSTPSFDPTTL